MSPALCNPCHRRLNQHSLFPDWSKKVIGSGRFPAHHRHHPQPLLQCRSLAPEELPVLHLRGAIPWQAFRSTWDTFCYQLGSSLVWTIDHLCPPLRARTCRSIVQLPHQWCGPKAVAQPCYPCQLGADLVQWL